MIIDKEELQETLEILSDKKLMAEIRDSLRSIEQGDVLTEEEVFGREL